MSNDFKNDYAPPGCGGCGSGGEFRSKNLDVSQLEGRKLKQKDGETVLIARCPACAEEDADNSFDHLIVFRDGRFGCVVHEGESDHRRRIWELIGWKKKQRHPPFIRRYHAAVTLMPVQSSVRVISIGKATNATKAT